MTPTTFRTASVCVALALATSGCARDLSAPVASQGQRASFEAARERCGVTVVETDAVKRCMRAQGWEYRLPWQ